MHYTVQVVYEKFREASKPMDEWKRSIETNTEKLMIWNYMTGTLNNYSKVLKETMENRDSIHEQIDHFSRN